MLQIRLGQLQLLKGQQSIALSGPLYSPGHVAVINFTQYISATSIDTVSSIIH